MRCTTESTPFRAADNSARRDYRKRPSGFARTKDRDSQSIALRRFSGHLSRAMIRATVRQKQQQFMIVNNSASFQQQIALK